MLGGRIFLSLVFLTPLFNFLTMSSYSDDVLRERNTVFMRLLVKIDVFKTTVTINILDELS